MAQESKPTFIIDKVYAKDISLEVPHAPDIFLEKETPKVEIALDNKSREVGKESIEVAIATTVTAKVGQKVVFLVEVVYAGVFQIKNLPEKDLGPIVGVTCPNIIFPYVRQVVSEAISMAGFPPIVLQPVNFEAIYKSRHASNSDDNQELAN